MKHLEINRTRIQDFLNPVQGLNVYFVDYKDNFLVLDVSNLQRLPIEIQGIEFDNKYKVYRKEPILIHGQKPFTPLKRNIIKIDCRHMEKCKKLTIDEQKIIFKILGQEEERKAEISKHYYESK